jgi:DNA replication protein DnaC
MHIETILKKVQGKKEDRKQRKAIFQLQTIDNSEEMELNKKLLFNFMPVGYIPKPDQNDIIEKMILYFNGDPKIEDYSISLDKGICLMGNWGIGKTILFNAFRDYMRVLTYGNSNLFTITSMEDIILELQNKGNMNRFTWNVIELSYGVTQRKPQNIVINEFGVKYDAKHFGSDINELLDSFLMIRYEIFQSQRKLTHVTTNYDWKDISNNYDIRLHDRFKEMFNFIPFPGQTSLRK